MSHAKDKKQVGPFERVLLVEDDPTARDGLIQVCKRFKCDDVRDYGHPEAARVDLQKGNWSPDCVFLDVFFPPDKHRERVEGGPQVINDGIALLSWMRSRGYEAPIHMITFRPTKETHNRCVVAGATSVIDRYDDLKRKVEFELTRRCVVIDSTMALDMRFNFYVHWKRTRLASRDASNREYGEVLYRLAERGVSGLDGPDLKKFFREELRPNAKDPTDYAYHKLIERLKAAVREGLADNGVEVPDGWDIMRYERSEDKYYLQELPVDAAGFSK